VPFFLRLQKKPWENYCGKKEEEPKKKRVTKMENKDLSQQKRSGMLAHKGGVWSKREESALPKKGSK